MAFCFFFSRLLFASVLSLSLSLALPACACLPAFLSSLPCRPLIANLQTYYPELVGSATLINTPSLFVHLWGIISPWLSPSVRQRVSTVDPKGVSDILARLVPPSNLPRIFGGQCAEVPEDVRRALGLDARTCRLRGLYA